MSTEQKFKVTKVLIDAYVNNGFTVKMMADDITLKSGVKCSAAVVRDAAKTYGINLRFKKNPSHFVFEDLDSVASVSLAETIGSVVAENTTENTYVQVAEPTVEL
jgi:hypothetical protein